MLTPQELKDIRFDKAMFGGYDMASVDETIAQIASDYTALMKENAVLKNKLKLLATTIEEYRSVDEAMRKALVTAQNMANDMLKDARAKSDELIKNASAVANAKVADLAAQIQQEETRLTAAKAETAKFVDAMIEAYKGQTQMILQLRSNLPDTETEENSLENTISLAADEINKCVTSAMENMKAFEARATVDVTPSMPESEHAEVLEEMSEESKESLTEEQNDSEKDHDVSVFEVNINQHVDTVDLNKLNFEEEPKQNSTKSREFDFEDLKFGKNYDFDD